MTATTPRADSEAPRVLDVTLEGVHPIGTGSITMPRRWPVLSSIDGLLFDAYRDRPTAYLPRIVHRRFRSGPRSARSICVHFNEDFSMTLTDSVWRVPFFQIRGNDSDWYILSLRLTGDTIETINGRDHRLGDRSCYLIRYGSDVTYVMRSVSDQPLGEVTVLFRLEHLALRLGIPAEDLARRLHSPDDPWYSTCRMTAEMMAAVRRLRRRSPTSPAYQLFAEATALELVAMYLTTIHEEEQGGAPQRFSDQVSRLHRARRHLEENYASTLELDALAALVGLSPKTLTAGFRREFGKTVHEYHVSVRMDVAKVLLRDGVSSVLGVAQRIGYGYPGNFSKAFLRHTGVTPRDYRAGRVPEPADGLALEA